jgi:hypothetical protein
MVWMEFSAMIAFLGPPWNAEIAAAPLELDGVICRELL